MLVLVGDYARGAWKANTRYARIAGITLLFVGSLWEIQGGRFGQAKINLVDNPLAGLSAGWRILNALRVAWKYAGLHFYPASLSCDYSFNQIPVYLDWRHTLPAAVAAVAAVGQPGCGRSGNVGAAWSSPAAYLSVRTSAITANILIPTGTIMQGERLAYLAVRRILFAGGDGLDLAKGSLQRMVMALGLLAVIVAVTGWPCRVPSCTKQRGLGKRFDTIFGRSAGGARRARNCTPISEAQYSPVPRTIGLGSHSALTPNRAADLPRLSGCITVIRSSRDLHGAL